MRGYNAANKSAEERWSVAFQHANDARNKSEAEKAELVAALRKAQAWICSELCGTEYHGQACDGPRALLARLEAEHERAVQGGLSHIPNSHTVCSLKDEIEGAFREEQTT